MGNVHKNYRMMKQAMIPADATFIPIKEGWDIEQMMYPAGWSWVRRFEEPEDEWAYGGEVVKTCALIGWALLRNRETGEAAFVGITADPETPAPYPACDADGFEGYVNRPAGVYLEQADQIEPIITQRDEG